MRILHSSFLTALILTLAFLCSAQNNKKANTHFLEIYYPFIAENLGDLHDSLGKKEYSLVFGKKRISSDKNGIVSFTEVLYQQLKNKSFTVDIPGVSALFYENNVLQIIDENGKGMSVDLTANTLEQIYEKMKKLRNPKIVFALKENANNEGGSATSHG